ncbi:MAG: 30S ribosomal protein S6 [Phycisphaerae bacterium]|nr:30S ribosomal protein S6 [Phycisphaerae bacterium]
MSPQSTSKELYEGLFLFNTAQIGPGIQAASTALQRLMERAEAEVEAEYKWDERRLAYEIEGQRRGLYLLSYFRTTGDKIASLERDVQLSDEIMRCLILRAEHIGETELELARQKQEETRTAAALEQERAEQEPEPEPVTAAVAEPAETPAPAAASDAPAAADPAPAPAEN